MSEKKHYVFSARTTKEGLQALTELKGKLGVGWDGLVIDAVCAHYGLDTGVMAIPKPVKAEKQDKPKTKAKRTRATKAKEEASTSA